MSYSGVKGLQQRRHKALYRIIWRWHFYAGLFCIPLVITLSISGAIYLFKPQVDAWVDRPYQNLTVAGLRTTANQQIVAALKAVPGARFSSYQLPERVGQAVVIHLVRHGEKVLVYVNPYTLEVLKTIGYEKQFIRMVRTFHGELLAGNAGSVVVELAACWAIVLVITGLYLWWPRSASGLAGTLYPRLRQGGRVFWRDLHAVTGVWISAMVLFLLVTGLPWALVWGSAFKEFRQWNAPPVVQDWSLSRAEERADATRHSVAHVDLNETLLANAIGLNFAPPVLLSVSHDNPNVWTVKSQHQNRPLRADAWLNGETGEVIKVQPFQERPLIDRIVGIGVAAHEGQLFGWFNQLLGVITAVGLVAISVSGFVLWRRRKPVRELGAPPPFPDARVGKAVVAVTLLLAAVLPLLALSLLVIMLLEWLVLKRFKTSRRWLGLQGA
jgi:uncharacterized iron-regulated membrane protein